MIRRIDDARLDRDGRVLTVAVTGGAGFIGTNLVDRLASWGHRVLVYDDLSRPGVEENLRWLQQRHPESIEVELACVTDSKRIRRVVRRSDAVFHLAAQVAVTTSIGRPDEDFSINLRGTLEILEAMRACAEPPHLVFTSTNKVYGELGGVALEEGERGYGPRSAEHRAGVSEAQRLDFRSPYGCSKGGADQYVLDYSRTYGLPTTVFRMSCIYGPHQHGTEDQGWVAHFMIKALEGRSITIYGDGKQVRDILHVSDLVDALLLTLDHRQVVVGRAFNIGGGPQRAVSLLDVLDELESMVGEPVPIFFEEWRTGDQRWYVSDTSAFGMATGWAPRIGVAEGLRSLYDWLAARPREREETLEQVGVAHAAVALAG